MNEEERRVIGRFKYDLTQWHCDEGGLTTQTRLPDMNEAARYSLAVKHITRAGDTPEQLLLHQLATLTQEVLISYVIPNGQAVREWLVARSELVQLTLTCD